MRSQVQRTVRRSGVPSSWNGNRAWRDKRRGRLRGLVQGVHAESCGHSFRVGRDCYIGVAPDAALIIGDQVTLYDRVRLNVERALAVLTMGDRSYLNLGTQIFCRQAVSIGAGTAIGFGCLITDTNFHTLDGDASPRPVLIGDNVWLGAGVIVLPGVTIGENAVVGAGSVVSRDIPAGQLASGVPARPRRAVTWAP